MILGWPVDDIKVDSFGSEVLGSTEYNIECYGTQWTNRFSRDDAMEGIVRLLEALERDVHLTEAVRKDDIDSASSIHEDASHVKPANLRLEDQG